MHWIIEHNFEWLQLIFLIASKLHILNSYASSSVLVVS